MKPAIAAAIVGCYLLAAPATAHASEAGYLARLGVDYDMELTPDSEAWALKVGYVVCQNVRNGITREHQVQAVRQAIPYATPNQAGGIVFAAHQELCPDTDPDGHGI